jgi:hypothetical protein
MISRFPSLVVGLAICGVAVVSCQREEAWIEMEAGAGEASSTPIPRKAEAKPVSFNHDIRPILSENCFFCHGFDPETREDDLRLDEREAALADRGGYAVIVPGDREASELWKRINDTGDPMPPHDSHKELDPEEIELLGRWINEGAEYQTHWAYVAPSRPEMPAVSDPEWPANPIDSFILAKLDDHGVEPSPAADRRTLMRRVALDLTGLPPTPEEVASFLADESPEAYERYVDELLARPQYGEHLAVWWLDLVRYADTIGIHSDNPRNVWPYRDWVIRSLNANLPFDRFTIMQLAGDLMQPEPTRDMLVASAYNRLNLSTEEGGAQAKEYQVIYNVDRVTNYGEVWLGSSVGCAQCHDHKFDPITMRDFYSMTAFFGSLNGAAVGVGRGYAKHEPPFIFLPENEEQERQIAEVEARYREMIEAHPGADLVEEFFGSRGNARPALPQGELPAWGRDFKQVLDERHKLAEKIPTVPVARDLHTPRPVRVLARGNWQDESGEIVAPATPEFLDGPESSEDRRLNRLDLAKWTVSPDNPLTARVIANRLWGRYLGSPLSANPIDLGSQGTAPTHPELLDWLALEFRESGWDLKHLIRLIVTSRTYRQSSDARDELAVIDPSNRKLYARQSARRLPAEAIRDQALKVSGLLHERIGGPSVFPYQPEGHWEPLNFPKRKYPTSSGDDLYRRGLYTWAQRTFPHPMGVTFDAPSRESCTGQRMTSTTPLQALGLLNGPTYVEAARVLAEDLLQAADQDVARLETLFLRVLSRPPRDSELEMLDALIARQRNHFQASPEEAATLAASGEATTRETLDPVEVATWTQVCRAILNLHETITRH